MTPDLVETAAWPRAHMGKAARDRGRQLEPSVSERLVHMVGATVGRMSATTLPSMACAAAISEYLLHQRL